MEEITYKFICKNSVDKDFVTINDVINSSEVREAVTIEKIWDLQT